jgi:4-amino-4-deoxy-L-arabinose transferase-like glycosyltransferase
MGTTRRPLAAILSDALQRLNLSVILWLAAVLRVASILVLRTYRHPQTWEFGFLANNILKGFGYSYAVTYDASGALVHLPSAVMPPAYPFVLAGFFRVLGERPATYLTIEFVNAALGVLLVYLVYRTARGLLSENAARLAALICAVYPAQVYMCNEFHSISFYIVLGVAVVFFLNRCLNQTNAWSDAVWGGLCMGVLLLFRAEALAIVLVYAVCMVVRKGARGLGRAAVFAAVSVLIMSPWVIRNAVVFHTFIPTMSTPGFVLWFGHNPAATGSQHYDWEGSIQPDLRRDLSAVPFNNNYEVELDKVYKRYAIAYIRTHPKRELELALRKLRLFFLFDPAHNKGDRPLYWVPSILMTCVAACGAFLRGRRVWREDLLMTATICYAVLVAMALLVLPRYKMVIDPFFMIFAAAVLDRAQYRVPAPQPAPTLPD